MYSQLLMMQLTWELALTYRSRSSGQLCWCIRHCIQRHHIPLAMIHPENWATPRLYCVFPVCRVTPPMLTSDFFRRIKSIDDRPVYCLAVIRDKNCFLRLQRQIKSVNEPGVVRIYRRIEFDFTLF